MSEENLDANFDEDSSDSSQLEGGREDASYAAQDDDWSSEDSKGQEQGAEDGNIPFHEHPRWKEVIEQNNQFKSTVEELQKRDFQYQQMIQQLQAQQQQSPQPKVEDALIAELKQAHPEFAARFEALSKGQETAQELAARVEQMEQTANYSKVESKFNELASSNKVPDALKEAYWLELSQRAQQNPNLGFQDIDRVFSDIHKKYSEFLGSQKREQTKQYVQDKKGQAGRPSPQRKGAPASKQPVKRQYASRDEMLEDIARSAIAKQRAGEQI